MTISVRKKSNESVDQILGRFNKLSQRFVKKARRSRFLDTSRGKELKARVAAVIAAKHRAERERKKHYE